MADDTSGIKYPPGPSKYLRSSTISGVDGDAFHIYINVFHVLLSIKM
jgi:hypothetical protein